jgi:hypothetical protein
MPVMTTLYYEGELVEMFAVDAAEALRNDPKSYSTVPPAAAEGKKRGRPAAAKAEPDLTGKEGETDPAA